MDAVNRFHTRRIHAVMRCEHTALLLACVALCWLHLGEIRWLRFWAAFWIIDVVGYLPGAVMHRLRGPSGVPRFCYWLYNVCHTYLIVGVGAVGWVLATGPEWSMLALPIHLSVDRGLFGNTLKPLALPFEPAPVAAEVILREAVAIVAAHAQSLSSSRTESAAKYAAHQPLEMKPR